MTLRKSAVTVGFIMLLAAFTMRSGALSAESDVAAVLKANDGFYAALNKMFSGDVGPITEVWSHADDIVYMGPSGLYERGWAATLKDWQAQAVMKLGGRVSPTDIHAFVGTDLAVVSDYEVGENTNAKGEPQRLRLRATNVYRKENGFWKMVDHHTDPLPYLTK